MQWNRDRVEQIENSMKRVQMKANGLNSITSNTCLLRQTNEPTNQYGLIRTHECPKYA